jgi:hypothetical protein
MLEAAKDALSFAEKETRSSDPHFVEFEKVLKPE